MIGRCWEDVEGLSKKEKEKIETELIDTDNSVVLARSSGVGGGEKGYEGINDDSKI